MNTPIKRRDALYLLTCSVAIMGCKKSVLVQPLVQSQSTKPQPISNSTPSNPDLVYESPDPSYLGQYGVTELGEKTIETLVGYEKMVLSYTDKTSYYPGDTMTIFMSAPESASRDIKIIDANKNTVLVLNAPTSIQHTNTTRPWLEGLGFKPTITFKIPTNFKSGLYKIVGRYNTPFIVKSPTAQCDLTVIYPSNTDNAYNTAGGKSIYGPNLANRSTVVSFLRFPNSITDDTSPFYDWLNKQSYSVNHICDMDTEDYKNLDKSKVVIIAGHSEYWTKLARKNIDRYVASGRNLLILSGNTMWWQVRYNKIENLMICYKGDKSDPLAGTPYNSDLWINPQLSYNIIETAGADFDQGGYLDQLPNRQNGYTITNMQSPLFESTGLKNGDLLILPTHEGDGAPLKKMIVPGSKEIPEIDNSKLNFRQIELLAYDYAIDGAAKGVSTFIVFKKTEQSGTVVNVASQNWCSVTGIGGKDGQKIATITKNMIDKSLNKTSLFSAKNI